MNTFYAGQNYFEYEFTPFEREILRELLLVNFRLDVDVAHYCVVYP